MEKILQYMWQFRLWGSSQKSLTDGRHITLLDPGKLNTDAGPDFFNSKIAIDGVEWAGNVEIHIRASDWHRHGHDSNPAYDSVILHVVAVNDAQIMRNDGTPIPQLELPLDPAIVKDFSTLQEGTPNIRCASFLPQMPSISLSDWLETLAFERLQLKSKRLIDLLDHTNGDWEEVCYVYLARSLGFGLNSDPFEMLARSLPLKILRKHGDNLLQLEALLFGQAGMLDMSEHILDEYYQVLCREYYFLMHKYSLKPMARHIWKFARTRPANFPHRRIALLAKFAEGGFSIMRRLVDSADNVSELKSIFSVRMSGYWENHSSFDTEGSRNSTALSDKSVELLLINLVAPLFYAYSSRGIQSDLEERAVDLLADMPAESNSIISQWAALGIKADNALRSQALIQLRKEYCDTRKCLDCRIGNRMLRMAGKQ